MTLDEAIGSTTTGMVYRERERWLHRGILTTFDEEDRMSTDWKPVVLETARNRPMNRPMKQNCDDYKRLIGAEGGT